MMEDSDFELTLPSTPPQMEAETNASLVEILESAPAWDPNLFAIELVVLARRHVCIRSLLGFALELGLEEQKKLNAEDEPNEMFRHQGAIRMAFRHHQIIFDALVAADDHITPKKEEVENASSHLSP